MRSIASNAQHCFAILRIVSAMLALRRCRMAATTRTNAAANEGFRCEAPLITPKLLRNEGVVRLRVLRSSTRTRQYEALRNEKPNIGVQRQLILTRATTTPKYEGLLLRSAEGLITLHTGRSPVLTPFAQQNECAKRITLGEHEADEGGVVFDLFVALFKVPIEKKNKASQSGVWGKAPPFAKQINDTRLRSSPQCEALH